MSSLPGGTAGVRSCSAASAGKRKFPASSHTAERPATTPGPTEPNHPRAAEIHRPGPQLPLKVGLLSAGRAEPVSAVPSAAAIRNTAALLCTTSRVRLPGASESQTEVLRVRRVTFANTSPGRGDIRAAVCHEGYMAARATNAAPFDLAHGTPPTWRVTSRSSCRASGVSSRDSDRFLFLRVIE